MKPYITVYLPEDIHARVKEVMKYYEQPSISALVERMFEDCISEIDRGSKYHAKQLRARLMVPRES